MTKNRSFLHAVVSTARPRQWLKNLLVFAGPAAAGGFDSWATVSESLWVFAGFSATASGTYFLNDVVDRENDRRHPTKSSRAIAAGQLSYGVALVIGFLLLLLGIYLASVPRWQSGAVVALYALLTVMYSLVLKRIPLVELAVIAAGFVLRAMAGAAGTETPMSTWFLLSITFGSLFVASGKRFAELLEMGERSVETRSALSSYTLTYLRQLIVFSCTATAIAYFLWAFENAADANSSIPYHELSIIPMVLALLRYLMVLETGKGGAPEEVFMRDWGMRVYASLWLVLYVVGVYAT
jgi:decaprenyl-phosphate phosphoribosyltransferase